MQSNRNNTVNTLLTPKLCITQNTLLRKRKNEHLHNSLLLETHCGSPNDKIIKVEQNEVKGIPQTCSTAIKDNFKRSTISKQDISYHFEDFENNDTSFILNDTNLYSYVSQNDIEKLQLLSLISSSLFYKINLRDEANKFRKNLLTFIDNIAEIDPEFILKIALYSRQELNIRQVSNFILAYCAQNESCNRFLTSYLPKSIVLPSDWLEVVDLYQIFVYNKRKNKFSIPSALRKALKETFNKFDEYQLAKYNKNSVKKKKLNKDEDVKAEIQTKLHEKEIGLTIKKLIQLLHISKPPEYVMAILGKKYPSNSEEFQQSSLQGIWNSELAGKRMKLKSPETWETAISKNGNKANVWETLIDNKKLPYMATLRNIRNLIKANISTKHHKMVQDYLSNEKAVKSSRQLPNQYFTASEILTASSNMGNGPNFNANYKNKRNGSKKIELSPHLVLQYKATLERAMTISLYHNLSRIPGQTLVISDPASFFSIPSFQNYRKLFSEFILLTLLFTEVCEYNHTLMSPLKATLNDWSLLENKNASNILTTLKGFMEEFDEAVENANNFNLGGIYEYLDSLDKFLNPFFLKKIKLDSIVVLTCFKWFEIDGGKEKLDRFVNHYRQLVNPEVTFTVVDIFGKGNDSFEPTDSKDLIIKSPNVQILRFLSAKGSNQMAYVNNIDQKYSIKKLPKHIPKKHLNIPFHKETVPRWKTVRIFISSTFKDMHGERDLFSRFVLPELKVRAATLFINVNAVDLRWGLPELNTEAESLEICLNEALLCDLFISFLGERYGTIPSYSDLEEKPGFEWLKSYPKGASITELEIYCAALSQPAKAKSKAFFYIRNNEFMKNLDPIWKNDFGLENNSMNKIKLDSLKLRVKKSGCEVFEGYPCQWGGVLDGQPYVIGLETLAERILDNLWQTLLRDYSTSETSTDLLSDHKKFASKQQLFVGHEVLLEKIISFLNDQDSETYLLIEGSRGSGKTSLMMKIYQLFSHKTFPLFANGSSSLNMKSLIKILMRSLSTHFNLDCSATSSLYGQCHSVIKCLEGYEAFIILDSMEEIEDFQKHRFNYLPNEIPKGIKIIITSCSPNSVIEKELSSRNLSFQKHSLSLLDLNLRKKLIQNIFQLSGKSLDSSTFDNQLLSLAVKQDAKYPSYIIQACHHMMNTGNFEKLSSQIKSLPQSFHLLLHCIIDHLELVHGAEIVQNMLAFLTLSKQGMRKDHLHYLLTLSIKLPATNKNNFSKCDLEFLELDNLLPTLQFVSLVQNILQILDPLHDRLSPFIRISNVGIMKILTERCFKSKSKEWFIGLLSAFYLSLIEKQKKMVDPFVIKCLLQSLFDAQNYTSLSDHLCNLLFLKQCLLCQIQESIFEAFYKLKEIEAFSTDPVIHDYLEDFSMFFNRNYKFLSYYPDLIYQQALNEPNHSKVYQSITDDYDSNFSEFELLNKYDVEDLCTNIHYLGSRTPICISVSSDFIAAGCEDGVILLISLKNNEVEKTLIGHRDSITDLTFAKNIRLCSASKDNSLSIWNVDKGIRLFVLSGHNNHVTACKYDGITNACVSSSWDCTLRIWSNVDGREISVLKTKKLINCIVLHHEKSKVYAGCWDSDILIYDLIELKRIGVLKGHKNSISSITLSKNSKLLISSTVDGEILLWSSAFGRLLSKISSEGLKIHSIIFDENGDLLTAGRDSCINLWKISHQSNCNQLKLTTTIQNIAFLSPDYLCIFKADNTICIWSTSTGEVLDTGFTFDSSSEIYFSITCKSFRKKKVFTFTDSVENTKVFEHVTKRQAFLLPLVVIFSHPQTFEDILKLSASSFKEEEEKNFEVFLNQLFLGSNKTVESSNLICCGHKVNNLLILGNVNGKIIVYDEATKSVENVIEVLSTPITSVLLKNDLIAAGGRNGSFVIYNINGESIYSNSYVCKEVTAFNFLHRKGSKSSVDLAFNNMLLASFTANEITIGKPFVGSKELQIKGHLSTIHQITAHTTSNEVISCSSDNTIRHWNIKPTSPNLSMGSIVIFDIYHSKNLAFTGNEEGTLILWALEDSQIIKLYQNQWPKLSFITGTFLFGREILFCLGNSEESFFYHLELDEYNKAKISCVTELAGKHITILIYHHKMNILAAMCHKEKSILLYNTDFRLLNKIKSDHNCFLPFQLTQQGIYFFNNDTEIQAHKIIDNKAALICSPQTITYSCDKIWPHSFLATDVGRMFIGDKDGVIHYSVGFGDNPYFKHFKAHENKITSLAFDSDFLISSDQSCHLKLWDVKTEPKMIGLYQTNEPLVAMEFVTKERLLTMTQTGQLLYFKLKL